MHIMQKRLIEELAKCRGGPNRLKKMRAEFLARYDDLRSECDEVCELLELIDDVTKTGEDDEETEKDAYQEATDAVTKEEPVDSIGE